MPCLSWQQTIPSGWLPPLGSKPPPAGGARVGKVGAIRAGADSPVEVFAEQGVMLADSGYRLADRAGQSDSSRSERMRLVDRGRRGRPRARAAERGSRVRRPPARACRCRRGRAPARCRLRSRQTSAVRVLGSRVEHLARVAENECEDGPPGRSRRASTVPFSGDDEIEHVELPAGGGEKPREVPHALEVCTRTVRPSNTTDQQTPSRRKTSKAGRPDCRQSSPPSMDAAGAAVCAAAIRSRIARAACKSKAASCSLPPARRASARPTRAGAAS